MDNKKIMVNLGCGWRNFGKSWFHTDGGDYEHLDSHDVFNLPFEDNTVDLIYASHIIQYFDRQEIVGIIDKWKAKLKPDGVLRLAVPDFEAMAKLYVNGGYGLNNFLGPLYGKMPMGDQTIYHRTTYDYNGLSMLLNDCGFKNVHRYDWRTTEHADFDDHSRAYIPKMDFNNGTLISLNVEAVK